jgi:hypothetical protein
MSKVFVSLLVALFAGLLPVPAQASHKPNGACSESGDVCVSAKRRNGERKLRIGLAAKYFDSYKLCVVAPDDSRECIKRNIKDMGQTYGDSVNWSTHFTDAGAGAYKAIWRQGGNRLGKVLGFHE